MAGSNHSDEDVAAGRVNRAEDWTRVWAQRTDSDDSDDFNGDVIFVVEVAKDVEDPDDYQNNDWTPHHPIHGILASGWSAQVVGPGGAPIPGNIGGVGVIGNGGNNQGTGVLSKGGGEGIGGIGVHGIGGSQSEPTWDDTDPPGTGVLGQGGRQATNEKRLPHGAGMVGLAGGSGKPIPPLVDAGSVGVYGQGAEAEERTVNINGVDKVVGPIAPGLGVLGRGGVPIPREHKKVAAGVIGLAGDAAIPPISETGDTGVYGGGPVGVFGHGSTHSGVRGLSEGGRGVHGETGSDVGAYGSATTTGRGGVFESTRSAQVRLVPQNQPTEFPTPVAVNPTAIRESEVPRLPKEGRGGDLMAIADNHGQCTLWFCVRGPSAGPARWAQVLLRPSFDGQA